MKCGTAHNYKKHGCRCDDCRAAHTAYYRELRARHRAGQPKTRGPQAGVHAISDDKVEEMLRAARGAQA